MRLLLLIHFNFWNYGFIFLQIGSLNSGFLQFKDLNFVIALLLLRNQFSSFFIFFFFTILVFIVNLTSYFFLLLFFIFNFDLFLCLLRNIIAVRFHLMKVYYLKLYLFFILLLFYLFGLFGRLSLSLLFCLFMFISRNSMNFFKNNRFSG